MSLGFQLEPLFFPPGSRVEANQHKDHDVDSIKRLLPVAGNLGVDPKEISTDFHPKNPWVWSPQIRGFLP